MLTNAYVTTILEAIRAECYLGLHFDDPELAGHYASECSGGGYKRVQAFFTETASRNIWLEEPVLFTGMLPTRVTHIGGWNKIKDGDLMFQAKLPSPWNIVNGGGMQLVTGDVVVSIV